MDTRSEAGERASSLRNAARTARIVLWRARSLAVFLEDAELAALAEQALQKALELQGAAERFKPTAIEGAGGSEVGAEVV